MLVEVELQLFVGSVDAQLLEAVLAEVLEASDVKNSYPWSGHRSAQMTTTADIDR